MYIHPYQEANINYAKWHQSQLLTSKVFNTYFYEQDPSLITINFPHLLTLIMFKVRSKTTNRNRLKDSCSKNIQQASQQHQIRTINLQPNIKPVSYNFFLCDSIKKFDGSSPTISNAAIWSLLMIGYFRRTLQLPNSYTIKETQQLKEMASWSKLEWPKMAQWAKIMARFT